MSRVPPSQPKRGQMTVEEFRQWKDDVRKLDGERFKKYVPRPVREEKPMPNLYDEDE